MSMLLSALGTEDTFSLSLYDCRYFPHLESLEFIVEYGNEGYGNRLAVVKKTP